MNEEFVQWVYKRAFYIIRHPNDFMPLERLCAQVVDEWYANEYCSFGDKCRYIPDGSIEVVCKAFEFQDLECQADILADLEELRAAGDCEDADDLDQEQDEYHSLRDCDHDLDADLTYFEGSGVL